MSGQFDDGASSVMPRWPDRPFQSRVGACNIFGEHEFFQTDQQFDLNLWGVSFEEDCRADLERWLASYIECQGSKRRHRICSAYIAGLIGPGDCKSIQTIAATALQRTLGLRQPPSGCVHHADHRNCSEAYRQILSAHGFLVSISRKANCWDNAGTKRFFKTLKTELM